MVSNTNVFSLLPWDIKHAIAGYLENSYVMNEVLRRDERVYKKFPTDHALKHALCVLKQEHNSIIRRCNIYVDLDGRYDRLQRRRAANCMFRFCINPRSTIAFNYQGGVKEKLIRFITPWLDEDHYGYNNMKAVYKEALLGNARLALECVSQAPFIRHIVT
jgi:hypothetical protein